MRLFGRALVWQHMAGLFTVLGVMALFYITWIAHPFTIEIKRLFLKTFSNNYFFYQLANSVKDDEASEVRVVFFDSDITGTLPRDWFIKFQGAYLLVVESEAGQSDLLNLGQRRLVLRKYLNDPTPQKEEEERLRLSKTTRSWWLPASFDQDQYSFAINEAGNFAQSIVNLGNGVFISVSLLSLDQLKQSDLSLLAQVASSIKNKNN